MNIVIFILGIAYGICGLIFMGTYEAHKMAQDGPMSNNFKTIFVLLLWPLMFMWALGTLTVAVIRRS